MTGSMNLITEQKEQEEQNVHCSLCSLMIRKFAVRRQHVLILITSRSVNILIIDS